MENLKELTTEEFDKLLEEQTPLYNKWTDLEINKIYTITNTALVNTKKAKRWFKHCTTMAKYGLQTTLKQEFKKKKKKKNKLKLPMYIRPRGLKSCKDNPANKYHAYDLVNGKQ